MTSAPENPESRAPLFACLLALAVASTLSIASSKAGASAACTDDAMIVFDASGSMAGNRKLGLSTSIVRIDEARSALASALPEVTQHRRVGLITYGPGPYNQCNVQLGLRPSANALDTIMEQVNRLVPAGKTPLASAVERAANVLDYQSYPGVVVVLTDGEETCHGSPCELGRQLQSKSVHLVVHVIVFRPDYFSWTGEHTLAETRCLADETNGLYITARTRDELAAAFRQTLACPMISSATPK